MLAYCLGVEYYAPCKATIRTSLYLNFMNRILGYSKGFISLKERTIGICKIGSPDDILKTFFIAEFVYSRPI